MENDSIKSSQNPWEAVTQEPIKTSQYHAIMTASGLFIVCVGNKKNINMVGQLILHEYVVYLQLV